MKKSLSASERALQIELVRARAALERQHFAYSVRNMSRLLTPAALVRGLFPGSPGKAGASWLAQGVALARRYPFLASGVSALLSRAGKRHRWWRLAAGLLLSWKVVRALGDSGAGGKRR